MVELDDIERGFPLDMGVKINELNNQGYVEVPCSKSNLSNKFMELTERGSIDISTMMLLEPHTNDGEVYYFAFKPFRS